MNKKQNILNLLDEFHVGAKLADLTAALANFSPRKIALRISGSYLVAGVLWILLSDRILLALVHDPQQISTMNTVKGWFYILVTAILLHYLIMISFSRIQTISEELLRKYKELTAVYQELEASQQNLQDQMKRLKESEERYRLISESTNDGIWDEHYGKRNFSERWYEITGYSKQEIMELEGFLSLIHPEDVQRVLQKLEENKKNRDTRFRSEYRLRFQDGSYRWILSRAQLLFDENGDIVRSAGSHTDITDVKSYEEQLKQLAYWDYLTGLPNRSAFYEHVKRYLEQGVGKKMALMFIDIDNFKYINDTMGHISGDKLISGIGERFLALANSNRSIYRIGGDEFIVFVHQYTDQKEIEQCAEEILQSFSMPFTIADSLMNVTISLGISLFPLHGHDLDTLLKFADIAMYKAKLTNRGSYILFDQEMNMQMQERMLLENELRKALEREELSLRFQPLLDISSGKIHSMEALLRWDNQKLGSVSPSKFIHIAEETSLINPIGDWVLLHACQFLKQLHDQGFSDISVSVNVSIIQLLQQNFTDKVMNILSQIKLDPQFVELEITESVLIESYDGIKDKLLELKAKGIRIALDDFGTGYSSLSYLTHIPINTLKIDKTFIDTISDDKDDKSLTSMIIMIGRHLGLSIVAEGVETEWQMNYLKEHNCHKIQGYYFSKPLLQDDLLVLLRQDHKITCA